jgi:orotidine-5'-phosphate decarboxylase
MSFMQTLADAWQRNQSLVCVGLDPDLARLPAHLPRSNAGVAQFCKDIVDATHDLVCAYKPQIAYFAALGAEQELKDIIDYIHSRHPGVPVILDAKRGDIGSTAEMYAAEAFDRYNADAVTVNPYLGFDSVEPFLRRKERGTILLCKTSNAGSADLQELKVGDTPLYEVLAAQIASRWNANGNCLLVVGATWPTQLARIRKIIGDMPVLVPGVGAQGGDVEQVISAGCTAAGTGLIISSSRAILYASNGRDFAGAARSETVQLRGQINRYRGVAG